MTVVVMDMVVMRSHGHGSHGSHGHNHGKDHDENDKHSHETVKQSSANMQGKSL